MKVNEELVTDLCRAFKANTATGVLDNGQTENTFDETTIRFDEDGSFMSLTTLVEGEVFGVRRDCEAEKITWSGVDSATRAETQALDISLRRVLEEV